LQTCNGRKQVNITALQACKAGEQVNITALQICKAGEQVSLTALQACNGGKQINITTFQTCKAGEQVNMTALPVCNAGEQTSNPGDPSRMRQPNWRDVRRHVRVPTTPIEFGSQETRKGKSDQKSSFSDVSWKWRGVRLSGQNWDV
jgi:hypothetical protein